MENIDERIVLSESKLANHSIRIDKLETSVSNLKEEIIAIDKQQGIIEAKLNSIIESIGRLDANLGNTVRQLQEKPAKRWETLIGALIGALVSAFVAYVVTK